MSFMHDIAEIAFPEDWTWHTIEEVAHFSRGLSWAKRDETDKDNGNLVVSIPNVRDGHIDFASKFNHYLGCAIPESKRLRVGDIVFVGSSGSLQNVGRNAKVRQLPSPIVAFASFTFKATPDHDVVDPDFFYHLVNSDLVPFEDYCSRAADGKYNFQLVDFKSKQQLRLPRKAEQQSIAQVLSTVQAAIEQQERLIRTTTELKQALMQKLFTEGLRGDAQKETEIGLVPESWEMSTVGDHCAVLNGFAFKSEDYVTTNGILNFRVVNINWDGTVSLDNDRKYLPKHFTESYSDYLLNEGDILFVMVGATRGKLAQVPQEALPALMNQNMWRIVPETKKVDQDFLYFYLNRAVKKLLSEDEDQARGFFKKADFRSIPLPIPPLEVQQEIAEAIRNVETRISQLRRKSSALQDLFRTLLHELMTGKVRVGNVMP